ncbi:MAG TPA: hypothetical protein QGI39_01855 [Gammaproteobacteria bacterium]|nr:hypothetical protein [Gammaproteobacteria bacterium]
MSKSIQDKLLQTQDVFSSDELESLCRRIIASGELGRSRHYRGLLEYLVQCSITKKTPKELELAIEVLDRSENFDVSTDSTVRVYMHQLRKKLDVYYHNNEDGTDYRIVIPKGQYTIAAIPQPQAAEPVSRPARMPRMNITAGLMMVAILLLLINLGYMVGRDNEADVVDRVAEHPVWNSVFGDELPIMLVMGDYYIFGELNANGNVARMVREFNVNSRNDLEELQFSEIERTENYLDLDLSYMPEGSAFALARIVPVLQQSGKPINITMMSDLTTADIRSNHIVYIGYISALEKLTSMAFAGSGLSIGRSYDELVNMDTEEYYTSDAGLPEDGEPFRDYGMFSTFPASNTSQVILISGMRDAGLMHTAQALSDNKALDDLVVAIDTDTDEALGSFEALYEVYGIDRMNFDADLVYARQLNSDQIWGTGSTIYQY